MERLRASRGVKQVCHAQQQQIPRHSRGWLDARSRLGRRTTRERERHRLRSTGQVQGRRVRHVRHWQCPSNVQLCWNFLLLMMVGDELVMQKKQKTAARLRAFAKETANMHEPM